MRYMGGHTMYDKICPQCGKAFMARKRTRFCSIRCSKIRNLPTKSCVQCGESFRKNPEYSYAVWEKIRFCSRACEVAARTQTKRTCPECGTVFAVGYLKQRYCSHECYWLSMRSVRFPTARLGNFTWTQKRKIRERDGGVCQRCGSTEDPEVDHIVPCHLGGKNNLANGQVLCRTCHRQKTDAELRAAFGRAA
jgi:5-methylcytosine-specific restriction endonuclease McrA